MILLIFFHFYIFFFFSSRRRHTRYIGDWSSDVCSSDLTALRFPGSPRCALGRPPGNRDAKEVLEDPHHESAAERACIRERSEERRVGKECRSRGAAEHEKEEEKHMSRRIVESSRNER